MKQFRQDGRRHNALKHGAFAQELIILGENQKDFDDLHSGFVEELKPRGRMEEEVVLELAKLIWRKRRIERLFVDRAQGLMEPAENQSLKDLNLIEILINQNPTFGNAWLSYRAVLPEFYSKLLDEEFGIPKRNSGDELLDPLRKRVQEFRLEIESLSLAISKGPDFIGKRAAKIHELTEKQMDLLERLDLMIDKGFKRLIFLKTFKEVSAAAIAIEPRKIEAINRK